MGQKVKDNAAKMSRKVSRWSVRMKLVSAVCGCVLVAAGAYAATNWVVGLNAGSSGEGQSATIANLSITAVASPAASNLLYPGGTGDVVVTIANPNPYPVTISAVQLPANTVNATGYQTAPSPRPRPAASPPPRAASPGTSPRGRRGRRTRSRATSRSGRAAASNNPLVVTLTNDASMATTSPAACANTYFSMPSFTGVTATGGAATSTTSPATDAWIS